MGASNKDQMLLLQILWKIPQNFVDNWYTAIIWYTAPQCPMECHSVMWNSGPEVRERSGNCPSHFHLLHFTFTLHSTPPLLRPPTLSELWGQQTKYDAAQYNTSYLQQIFQTKHAPHLEISERTPEKVRLVKGCYKHWYLHYLLYTFERGVISWI